MRSSKAVCFLQTEKEKPIMATKGYEFLQLLSRAILAPQISFLFPVLGNVEADKCKMDYYSFAGRIADAIYTQTTKEA